MDSEHRHELKTNELADWLSNAPEHLKNAPGYIKEHWWESICIVLIIIGAAMWMIQKNQPETQNIVKQAEFTQMYQKISTTKGAILQDQDTAGSLLTVSGELENIAPTADTKTQEALALIKSADALRSNLHYAPSQIDEATVNEQIAQSKVKYESALEKAAANKTIEAMAQMGIALCAEELRDFDVAEKLYREISENSDFQSTIFAKQAQKRLAGLADSKVEFTFEKAVSEAKNEDNTAEAQTIENQNQ